MKYIFYLLMFLVLAAVQYQKDPDSPGAKAIREFFSTITLRPQDYLIVANEYDSLGLQYVRVLAQGGILVRSVVIDGGSCSVAASGHLPARLSDRDYLRLVTNCSRPIRYITFVTDVGELEYELIY